MRTVGIICEYNPFHNGHAYQIGEARRLSKADTVVCVMSGNYVQRGEPAIADKGCRARWALGEGADLVLEMPTLWSCAGAPDFAEGAVRLLHAIGVDAISCGVETNALKEMQIIAQILNEESQTFRSVLQEELKKGNSFVRSREKAVRCELVNRGESEAAARILQSSNNILAIEYMRAVGKMKWDVPFVLVPRKGAGHDCEDEIDGVLSASAIRTLLRNNEEETISAAIPVPPTIFQELSLRKKERKLHPGASCFQHLLYYRVSMMKPEELKEIEGMGEGLENALIKACSQYRNWDDLVRELTAQRYPASRIRRMLLNVCLGITKEMVRKWKGRIPYLKVLCFNEKGQSLIRSYQKERSQSNREKMLNNPGREWKMLDPQCQEYLEMEAKWTDLYELTMEDPADYCKGQEYRMNSVKMTK